MNRRVFLVSIACLAMASWVAAKSPTKVIAHRGYWKTEGSAQNSLRSLEKAAEVKVYGSEFDVHLTADNVLIVNHDNDIQGKPIQTSTYAELKDLKLPNGENVPTLEQYLLKISQLMTAYRFLWQLLQIKNKIVENLRKMKQSSS